MTRFYIVRHGETVANKTNRLAGHYESPLTELGKKQGAMTGEALRHVKFDVAYCSPLERARDTARLIVGPDFPVTVCPEVIEMNLGEWEGRRLDAEYPEERAVWHKSFGICRPTGGESAPEARERMKKIILELAKENEGKVVLIVSHGGAILCLLGWVKGIPAEKVSKDGLPGNTAITIIDVENGVPQLVQAPNNSHLGDSATAMIKNA